MFRILTTFFLCISLASSWAQESIIERTWTITDKDLYLTGERLHVSICITDQENRPSTLSRVAYVEISDAHHTCAQAMVALHEGRGWADIALPATLHSGHYLVSTYTRAMRNQSASDFGQRIIAIVNPTKVSRADNVQFLPLDSLKPTEDLTWAETAPEEIEIPSDWSPLLVTATLQRKDLIAEPVPCGRVDSRLLTPTPKNVNLRLPEIEGHIVSARPKNQAAAVARVQLSMVGRQAGIYDGQWCADGSWTFFTYNLFGQHPAILTATDVEGKAVDMEFISPFAGVTSSSLPPLRVYCSEEDLQLRAQGAQLESELCDWLAAGSDTAFSADILSSQPLYSYDLDEYTRFSSVRGIITEFVRGVKRERIDGNTLLFNFDPETNTYSSWPALVLLDGMPITDIESILDYDARLLRFVSIYSDRFTFGNNICGGIISLSSRRGRLAGYKLGEASHLVSYAFPQDQPDFILPQNAKTGTLYWCPTFQSSDARKIPATGNFSGTYELLLQGFDREGRPRRKSILWCK